jgi:hypothetical protein
MTRRGPLGHRQDLMRQAYRVIEGRECLSVTHQQMKGITDE